MNYRIAYNFLNIELRSPVIGATEAALKQKGFTNLKIKPKKNQPLALNKLWITYRYNFIAPVSDSEPPLIRVDKWYRNISPEFNSHSDIGLMSWFPIYVVTEDKVNIDKIDKLYNTPIEAGSVSLVGLIWTLFKSEEDEIIKYKLLINNGVVGMVSGDKHLKKLRDTMDLMYIDSLLEENRNIEVV